MPSARIAVRWVCAWAVACAVLGPVPCASAADFDTDGIADAADNCPKVPNPTQADSAGVGSLAPNGRGNACECGDVTGDGGAQVNDATVIRRAFVGLGPGLARPELCNATGAVDARDLDHDGVRDDCDLADLVVLRRALVGLGPGIGSECGLIFSPDALQPRVTLTAPGEVTAGQGFTAVAQAEDDRGVGLLEIRVDGLRVGQVGSGGPLSVPVVAPALPGSEIAIEALAEDAAGNAGSASARVRVVQVADTTAPSVSLSAPPRAAPGSTLLLKASASDARGVESVVFYASGQQVAVDASPPYEASFTVPASAVVGSLLPVEARAQDASGNEASASAGVQIAVNGDAAAPTQVALSVPAQAKPGQTLGASATAQDDVGILAIEFFVDGVMIGEDSSAPYTASFPIPASRIPGERLVWTARARDFAGNAASSPEATTLLVAAGTGLVSGEVYDDSRSQPLAGARVRVVEAGGQPLAAPLELVSDARGRFAAPLVEGPAYLEISKDGYSGAERALEVRAGQVDAPLDARLTPRGAARGVDPVAGTTLSEGALALALPPGAFAAPTPLRVTALSEQGLPSPLPPGWSPLAAAELDASAPLRAEARLTFGGLAPPAGAIGARWDASQRTWRRIALEGAELTLDALGAVAVAVPDAGAPPAVSEALAGVAPSALPATASAQILPSPRILFPDPAARSQVTVRVATASALPSGTPLALEFRESYRRSDGSTLEPEGSTQDFLLYRRASGFEAEFAATPSEVFDGVQLTEGEIDLAAQMSDAADTASADAAGGALSRDGVSVQIPAGALAGPAPLSLARIPSAPALPAGMSLVAGVQFALAGAPLSAPAVLRVAAPTSLPVGTQVLVVRSVRVGSATRLELVGIAAREGAELVLRPGALGLPLPGADAAGSYLFVAPDAPLGFVAGVLRGAPGAPLARALVETGSLPFVSLVDAADPRFALAAGTGSAALDATELVNGALASGAIAVSAGNVSALDLTLASARPSVAAIDPADLAAQIDVDAAITVHFTRPLERGSVTAQSFRLLDGSTPVAGQISFGLGALSVTFRPDAPLRGLSAYTVALSGEIRDAFGNALLGNQLDGSYASVFETWDTAPPPRPAAGRITLSIPRDGETEIRGTPGTLAAGMLVYAFNRSTGSSTAAAVEADGSFLAALPAASADEIVLAVQSAAGAFTQLDPIPFTEAEGIAVLSPRGGAIASAGGVELSVLPGGLVRTDEVRLTDLPPGGIPADLPGGLTPLRAFRLDVPVDLVHSVERLNLGEESGRINGAERAATPLRLAVSRITGGGVTTTTRFAFVARAADAQGVERAVRVDAAGSPGACSGSEDAVADSVAPRLRLTAPTCLGPQQVFSLSAEAIQPRFDLSTAALPGDAAGTRYLVLRRVAAGSAVVWSVVETARVELSLGVPRVVSDSRAPLGLRSSGDYLVARADAPLGFVEGVVGGDAALVATDRSSLGAETSASNGAFLLAVPAGQSFALRTLSPEDGTTRSSEARASVGSGSTALVGVVGPAAAAPLGVAALPRDGGTVAPTGSVIFDFGAPVDPQTVSLSSLFVLDSAGRLVEGDRSVQGGGRRVEFRPQRPWRGGTTYTWRVTTEVAARDGARLPADATGAFDAFAALRIATLPGDDVRDAVARGSVFHIADGSRVRSVEASAPAAPVEGVAVSLTPAPNRLSLDTARSSLLITAGSASDYGELVRLDLASALAPALRSRVRLSTPGGAPPVPGAAPLPGTPTSLALLGSAVAISNRGIGLQRLELAALDGSSVPPLAFPPGGSTFTDVASLGSLLASVGPAGLQLHDAASLAVLAGMPVDGTAADVELVSVEGRTLALVGAGLVGGIQAFEISGSGEAPTLTRIAKILPGCAVQRIAADAPMRRAWFACSGVRIASLELGAIDGLEPIDADLDGLDDRAGAPSTLSLPLLGFSLDAPRNLGLVSAGAQGLVVLQLGGAEARITSAVRDPLAADLGDAEPILETGRVFMGDREVRVGVEARIPPGHPGMHAVLDPAGPIEFSSGGYERALSPGSNELELVPRPLADSAALPFVIDVEEIGGAELAAFAGSVQPLPIEKIVTAQSSRPLFSGTSSAIALEIAGRTSDGTYYNLAPLAEFQVADPALGSVGPDGVFHAAAGGETHVRYSVGAERGSFEVRSALAPALARLEVEPKSSLLRRAGDSLVLSVQGVLTDGSRRDLGAADGVSFSSLAPAIAGIDASGRVTALAEGIAEIRVASAGVEQRAAVTVAFATDPDVEGIELRDVGAIRPEEGTLFASARLIGSGSLEDIPVEVRLEGPGAAPLVLSQATETGGELPIELAGLSGSGTATLRVRVVDPRDGAVFTDSAEVTVLSSGGDAEPNDAPDHAVPIGSGAALEGSLDAASDARDFFRLELTQAGTLVAFAALDAQASALRLLDAAGGVAGEAVPQLDSDSGEPVGLGFELPVAAGAHLLELEATQGAGAYALELAFEPAVPRIDAIEPASAAPGALVAIRGAGFSTDPGENSVSFDGALARVVSAGAERLDVRVPAFAFDGPLTVSVAGRTSNGVAFSSGQTGSLAALHFFEPDATPYVLDPQSGLLVSPDRLIVGSQFEVPRARIEAIAGEIGAEIAGLFPATSVYVLRILDPPGLAGMRQIRSDLAQRPEIAFALPADQPSLDGFTIPARDLLSDRIHRDPAEPNPTPVLVAGALERSAYEQVNLFDAWEAAIESGYLEDAANLAAADVRVAVLDEHHLENANNLPVLPRASGLMSAERAPGEDPNHPPDPCNAPSPSHGTEVMSVIGAVNELGPVKGVRGPFVTGVMGGIYPAGMTPSYRLTLIDICEGSRPISPSLYYSALDHPGTRNRFDIINLSFGSPLSEADLVALGPGFEDSWKRSLDNSPQTLFVVAAGNKNFDAARQFPAALGDGLRPSIDPAGALGGRVLTVAGVGQGIDSGLGSAPLVAPCARPEDTECAERIGIRAFTPMDQGADRRTAFSNWGRALDIAAPSTHVLVTDAYSSPALNPPYQHEVGTSFAAPLVAGAAGLLKSLRPSLTAEQLHDILVRTATPIGKLRRPTVPGHPSGTRTLGWGNWGRPARLDALAAVQLVLACNAQGPSGPCPSLQVISDGLGATKLAPGRRRSVWIADNRKSRLYYQRFKQGFSRTSPGLRSAASAALTNGCSDPVGLALTPSGDKLYVACGSNDSLLLWNANRRSAGTRGRGAVPLIDLEVRDLDVVGNNTRMGVSRSGDFLAVPAQTAVGFSARKPAVALVDTRRDSVIKQIELPAGSQHVTAAEFDAHDNLYVLTTEEPRIGGIEEGRLFRIPRKRGADRTDTDIWDEAAIRTVPLINPGAAACGDADAACIDEPRGLEFQTLPTGEVLYVYFSGDRTQVAARKYTFREPPDPNQPVVISELPPVIPDRLPGSVLGMIPGKPLPSLSQAQTVSLLTTTKRAFDMEVEPFGGSGYLLYSWTGNLAVLEQSSAADPYRGLAGVTRIHGGDKLSKARNYKLVLDMDGKAEVEDLGRKEDGDLYFTTDFGQVMDLEQGGELIVAGYTGTKAFLDLFFTPNLATALGAYGPGLDRLVTPLDLALPAAKPVRILANEVDPDGPDDLDGPRDIRFVPQLSVVVPHAGDTLRGAVAVNTIARDERITRIRCALLDAQGTPVVLAPGSIFGDGGALSSRQQKLGLSWLPGPDIARPGELAGGVARLPICFMADLAPRDYVLEVTGVIPGGRDVKVRVPFRYVSTIGGSP